MNLDLGRLLSSRTSLPLRGDTEPRPRLGDGDSLLRRGDGDFLDLREGEGE